MNEPIRENCPDCDALDRRDFIRVVGGGAAAVAAGVTTVPAVARAAAPAKPAKARPAETMIKELYSTLSDDQKKTLVLPFDQGASKTTIATRLGMYNEPLKKQKIADNYTKAQQELVEKILKAILSGEDGFHQISRKGKWDASKTFDGCGSHIFGDPTEGKPWAWLFTGHHLTLRCDGDSVDGVAWGGPLYYGDSTNGWSDQNVFHYQTKAVEVVFKALDKKQQDRAVVEGNPKEGPVSIQFRKDGEAKPGIAYKELNKEQKELVEKAMREILSPYRKEDSDEVMSLLKANGGIDKLHLAFYQDDKMDDRERWHFWRLEGPGFVWNYRILPHVHCYVNVGKPA